MTGSCPTRIPRRTATWTWGVAVFVAALAVFGLHLDAEPPFVDEWAYVSQAFYLEKFAQPDDPSWLDYPSYDLPPLNKYLVGGSLKLAGYRLPPPSAARAWYANTHTTFGPPAMLTIARRPSVVLGALGCVAVFTIGTLAAGRGVGALAAGFLMLDPLYRMLARRAMSDVPAEALILTTAALGLWAWRGVVSRRWGPARGLAVFTLAGVCAGLATLAKLNGVLGLLILAAWVGLALATRPRSGAITAILLGCWLLAAGVAFGTFVLLNPFLTAKPHRGESPRASLRERCEILVAHRFLQVPREQQKAFPHNALRTPAEKAQVMAVQGFGRFGVLGAKRFDAARGWWFDSTRRFDWRQDRGALVWLPWVLAGLGWAGGRGRAQARSGEPPTAWAVLLQALVALLVVTTFLPLAWDRFFLSVQAGSCLLAAGVTVAALRGLAGAFHQRAEAR